MSALLMICAGILVILFLINYDTIEKKNSELLFIIVVILSAIYFKLK